MAQNDKESVGTDHADQDGRSVLADVILVLLFLALTFLLGVFPVKDTDFWWHLRTGDLIREWQRLPATDWLTFGAKGHDWIDLHWLFEILLSFGYQLGGVVFLNLAKCAVTTLAVALLILPRRRGLPIWAMLVGWLPGLFVLSGRMYVRPESLTLLYMAGFLAILARWERRPSLVWLLPIIQVFWVNTQGLFVLGPIVLLFALIDAATKAGAFQVERRRWWSRVLLATALTGAACLVNPYGIRGALFPIKLAGTMANPIFSRNIAELTPLNAFIEQSGLRNLPLQIHLAAMLLGGFSFVLTIISAVVIRLIQRERSHPLAGLILPRPTGRDLPPDARTGKRSRKTASAVAVDDKAPPARKRRRSRGQDRPGAALEPASSQLVFRVLLFASFSLLSFKATRNSHQFGTVVGVVTAWNLADWAYAVRRRRLERQPMTSGPIVVPRIATFLLLVGALWLVGSGMLYRWAGEGRTIGIGEEPFWFPHDAVKAAASSGTPDRFICFHDGHSAVYEYHNAPERLVYTDARLEVMGAALFGRYLGLRASIGQNIQSQAELAQLDARRPASDREDIPLVVWPQEVARLGDPGILVDLVHPQTADLAVTMLTQQGWRCIWFDAIAAVFLPEKYPAATRMAVDFAARHFRPRHPLEPLPTPEQSLHEARPITNLVPLLTARGRSDLAFPLILLGERKARRARQERPNEVEPWKYGGLLESFREPIEAPRYRMPFDPLFDLSPARTTYLLREALTLAPDDAKTLMVLGQSYKARGMFEAAYPIFERLASLAPPNQYLSITRQVQLEAKAAAALCLAQLGPPPDMNWRNMDELDRLLKQLIATGRAESTARFIESTFPAVHRNWERADQLATLWLHLGLPGEARTTWERVPVSPRPGLKLARIAATYLVEEDFETARRSYQAALREEPNLFEAHYGLALMEQDAGHADAALAAARAAEDYASNATARDAARAMIRFIAPYARTSPQEPAAAHPTAGAATPADDESRTRNTAGKTPAAP